MKEGDIVVCPCSGQEVVWTVENGSWSVMCCPRHGLPHCARGWRLPTCDPDMIKRFERLYT